MSSSPMQSRISAVAAANLGIITREQAFGLGLSERQIQRLLASGEWVLMHPGTYRIAAVAVTWELRLLAAVRAAERCPANGSLRVAVASHAAAAALHGIRPQNKARPEITVVGKAKPVLHGVTVHRTAALDACDIQSVGGIPGTTGARMLVDECVRLSDTEYLPLVDDTMCARVAHRTRTHDRAVQLRPGRPKLARLIGLTSPEAEDAFWSWLERTASQMIAAAGMPQPRWNVSVYDSQGRVGVVDAIWEWLPLIMELEGMRFHTQPAARQRDAERFNRLGDIARVRRFTYRDVIGRPDYVIASLRQALAVPFRR